MGRVQYPLTPEAKEAARYLKKAWGSKIEQYFVYSYDRDSQKVRFARGVISNDFQVPPYNNLKELSRFSLLEMELKTNSAKEEFWHILLLQELYNAVETDFEVSDYFLTFNAVGTIITALGNGKVEILGPVQGAASVYGDITQNTTPVELVDKLIETLGQSLLNQEPDLNTAIIEARLAPSTEQQSKLGKVISELGRCLEHVSNTKGVIEAILLVATYLSK